MRRDLANIEERTFGSKDTPTLHINTQYDDFKGSHIARMYKIAILCVKTKKKSIYV